MTRDATEPPHSSARPRWLDLALVLAALGLGTYLVSTAGGPTSEEILARENNLFAAFSPETIRSITLRGGQHSVKLRKVPDEADPHLFFLGESGHMPADPAVIEEVLSTLEYATWRRTLPEEGARDLAKLGFESPRLELSINAGARSYRLLLGKPAEFPDQSLYARVQNESGQAVTGVVDDKLLDKLLRGEQEFRGNALFLYGRSETSALAIEQNETHLQLRADSLGFLTEQSSEDGLEKIRAKRELSDLIFFQMARASISTFIDPTTAKSLIADDANAITVIQESHDAPRVSVRFGGRCPNDKLSTVAMRTAPDVVSGCVTRTILPALRISSEAIRDRSAAPLNPDEIDHVVIREKTPHAKRESKLDLIRSEDAFSLLSHDSERVELAAGQEFLEVLSTGVLDLVDSPPKDLKRSGEIVIKGQSLPTGAQSLDFVPNGNQQDPLVQELHLELYREASASPASPLWVHRLDDGAWLTVPKSLDWAFSPNDTWAKDRHLLQIEPDDILEVTVSKPDGWAQTLDTRENVVESAETVTADPLLSRRVLDELAHLEAVRFVAEDSSHAQAAMEITFSVRANTQAEKREVTENKLWIGRRTRGGYLAWSSFTEGTFVIGLPTRSIFNAPWGSRAELQIDVASITQLTARADDRTYLFERQGESLRPNGGAAVEDMVAPLEEAIRAINVIARVTNHPDGRSLRRGKPQVSLKLELDSGENFTVHIGSPAEWQGMNVHVAWREGEDGNFVIGKSSLDELLALL